MLLKAIIKIKKKQTFRSLIEYVDMKYLTHEEYRYSHDLTIFMNIKVRVRHTII